MNYENYDEKKWKIVHLQNNKYRCARSQISQNLYKNNFKHKNINNKKTRHKILFDIKTKINVMTYDIVVTKNLSIRFYLNVNFVLHNKNRKSFLNICENIKITIDEMIKHYHVFVIESTNYQLIFEQLFLL